MTVCTAERRRSVRVPAAYPAIVRGRRGRILTRGRTANISEHGVFLISRRHEALLPDQKIVLELTVPGTSTPRPRRPPTRTVRYRCRIVRAQALGQLVGLGIEFLKKLA